jgi:hypothetical protein
MLLNIYNIFDDNLSKKGQGPQPKYEGTEVQAVNKASRGEDN